MKLQLSEHAYYLQTFLIIFMLLLMYYLRTLKLASDSFSYNTRSELITVIEDLQVFIRKDYFKISSSDSSWHMI